MQIIKLFLKGAVIGVANIIPGVSGGTMALALGIYERLIAAIHNVSFRTLKSCFGLLKLNKNAWDDFWTEMKRIDAFFLTEIGGGAFLAIIALANVMTYLLDNQHDPTYGFFFGLVAVSAWVPFKLIKKHTVTGVLIALIALGGVVMLSNTMSGETMVQKEQKKYEIKMAKKLAQEEHSQLSRVKHSPFHLMLMFIAGAVAISAMILPGISGSFILLLMGAYFELLKAITYRDFLLLLVFALGCIIGILLFTRFLNLLLKKWHDQTMYFLLGLVIGSLWAIWPFKSSITIGKEKIYFTNQLPYSWGGSEMLTIGSMVLGGTIVALFIWLENKQRLQKNS